MFRGGILVAVRGRRRGGHVPEAARAAQERQAAHLLGAGRVGPHGRHVASSRCGLPGRPGAARAKRLGASGPASGPQGPAAAVALRSAAAGRAFRRRAGPGEPQGRAASASARLRRRVVEAEQLVEMLQKTGRDLPKRLREAIKETPAASKKKQDAAPGHGGLANVRRTVPRACDVGPPARLRRDQRLLRVAHLGCQGGDFLRQALDCHAGRAGLRCFLVNLERLAGIFVLFVHEPQAEH